MFSFALPRLLGFAASRDAGGAGRRHFPPASVPADEDKTWPAHEAPRAPRAIGGVSHDAWFEQLRADDADLAQRAVESLYHEYFSWLWRAAYRVTRSRAIAEEVVQEIFLQIWEHRRELVVHGDVAVYLYVAVRNQAYKQLRHDRVVDRHAQAAESAPSAAPPAFVAGMLGDPDGVLSEHEAARALMNALARVSPRDREILLLRWRDGWTYDEIARALGISSVAARVAVSRQQRRLRPVLDRLRSELSEP